MDRRLLHKTVRKALVRGEADHNNHRLAGMGFDIEKLGGGKAKGDRRAPVNAAPQPGKSRLPQSLSAAVLTENLPLSREKATPSRIGSGSPVAAGTLNNKTQSPPRSPSKGNRRQTRSSGDAPSLTRAPGGHNPAFPPMLPR